jgi:hypothetical protein
MLVWNESVTPCKEANHCASTTVSFWESVTSKLHSLSSLEPVVSLSREGMGVLGRQGQKWKLPSGVWES